MAVVEIKRYGVAKLPTEHQGETADTEAWLAAHLDEPNGSIYEEVDGEYRLYKMHNGQWRLQ